MTEMYTEDIGAGLVNRRAVFAGLLALPVASPAQADRDAAVKIRLVADALAISMQELHGGQWRVHIDHDAGLVAISKLSQG